MEETIREFSIRGLVAYCQSEHGFRIHENTVRNAMKRGDLPVRHEPNGRGGIRQRIVLEDPPCLTNRWLMHQMAADARRKGKLTKDELKWGDVYQFTFLFTVEAADLPQECPKPMTLPEDFRDNYDLAVRSGPARVMYQIWITEKNWREVVSDLDEAVDWILEGVPCELLSRFQNIWTDEVEKRLREVRKERTDIVRGLLELLRDCRPQRRREFVFRLLDAHRQFKNTTHDRYSYSEAALAKIMGISPSTLAYHKKSNPLASAVLDCFRPLACERSYKDQEQVKDMMKAAKGTGVGKENDAEDDKKTETYPLRDKKDATARSVSSAFYELPDGGIMYAMPLETTHKERSKRPVVYYPKKHIVKEMEGDLEDIWYRCLKGPYKPLSEVDAIRMIQGC